MFARCSGSIVSTSALVPDRRHSAGALLHSASTAVDRVDERSGAGSGPPAPGGADRRHCRLRHHSFRDGRAISGLCPLSILPKNGRFAVDRPVRAVLTYRRCTAIPPWSRLLEVAPPGSVCETPVRGVGARYPRRRCGLRGQTRSVSFGGVRCNRRLLPPATGSEDKRKGKGQQNGASDRRRPRADQCHGRTPHHQQQTNAAYLQVRSD